MQKEANNWEAKNRRQTLLQPTLQWYDCRCSVS